MIRLLHDSVSQVPEAQMLTADIHNSDMTSSMDVQENIIDSTSSISAPFSHNDISFVIEESDDKEECPWLHEPEVDRDLSMLECDVNVTVATNDVYRGKEFLPCQGESANNCRANYPPCRASPLPTPREEAIATIACHIYA